VDGSGAAYITGATDAHDFPTTRGAFQTVSRAGATDAFALTLVPNRRPRSSYDSLWQEHEEAGRRISPVRLDRRP
jgi:hypothetical protein